MHVERNLKQWSLAVVINLEISITLFWISCREQSARKGFSTWERILIIHRFSILKYKS